MVNRAGWRGGGEEEAWVPISAVTGKRNRYTFLRRRLEQLARRMGVMNGPDVSAET